MKFSNIQSANHKSNDFYFTLKLSFATEIFCAYVHVSFPFISQIDKNVML